MATLRDRDEPARSGQPLAEAESGSDVRDDQGSVTEVTGAPRAVLQSDPHDFAGLYLRHRTSFTLHARRYLKDARDADDVVQEAFLRLFLALPELETELQALAYCRRTITNLAIDRYRADARRPQLVDLESAPVDDLADDDPGDPVVRAEDAAVVRDALAMLPALHRAALVKREIEEKPLSVIAGELEIPEENVKHVLFRARRGLRKLLAATSLAPGVDAEGRRTGRPLGVRPGGVAALLVLLALGLGSGPDLEAVPVVGVDLPDVIGVTRLAETVGDALSDAVDKVTPGGDRSSEDRRTEPAKGGQRDTEAPGSVRTPDGATAVTPESVAVPPGTPAAPPGTAVLPPGLTAPGAGAPQPGAQPALPGTPAGKDGAAPGRPVVPPSAGGGLVKKPAEVTQPSRPAAGLPSGARPSGSVPGPPDAVAEAKQGKEQAKAATAERKDAAQQAKAATAERKDAAQQAKDAAKVQTPKQDKAEVKQAKQQAREAAKLPVEVTAPTKQVKPKVKVKEPEAPAPLVAP